MALLDVMRQMKEENAEKILENQLQEKAAGVLKQGRTSPLELYEDNPMFQRIMEYLAIMEDAAFWETAIRSTTQKMERAGENRELVAQKLALEFDRKEMIYFAYREIALHPLQMQERLIQLKKDLRMVDKELADYSMLQVSLFEDGEAKG